MKKILTYLMFFCLISLNMPDASANLVSSYIQKSGFENNSTISLYVKNTKNNNTVYKRNEKKLLNPASTLKVLTFGASYKVLGEGYKFETILYKDANNNLYIKLGADPLLSYLDLVELFSCAKEKITTAEINNIYIDDSIIDKTPYPNAWMQEDIWPNQRAITPYIIDNNFTNIDIKRSSLATKVDILQGDSYKIPIINELKLGDTQNYTITKEYGENSPIITFRGTIKEDESKRLPVLNPQINFVIKTNKALSKSGYLFDKKILFKKTPSKVTRISAVNHDIEEVSKKILFNSDNFASEIVSKVAAAKYIKYSHPATNEDMINMFYDIYQNTITKDIKITDSCGVSRNNFLNTEFLVNGFSYISHITKIENLMTAPHQGTLANRLLFLDSNLKAKTGTLDNMSSIMGILNTKKCNNLIFAIIVQNSPKRKAILKNFEDNIITILYRRY